MVVSLEWSQGGRLGQEAKQAGLHMGEGGDRRLLARTPEWIGEEIAICPQLVPTVMHSFFPSQEYGPQTKTVR